MRTHKWRRLWHRHFPPEYHTNPAAALLKAPGVIGEWYIDPPRLAQSIEHVSGPPRIDLDTDDVVGLSVVRNSGLHIDALIQHHLRLGVRHFVILDTGSNDDTIARAARYTNVTMLRTSLPYRRYEVVMKRYLAQRFTSNRWHLFVDADERFEYPIADRVPLRSLIQYLERGGYRSMVAQTLDLFPDRTLVELAADDADFERTHIFYDVAAIEKTPYIWGAEPGSPVQMHWGGIRREVFGTRNGLTKAVLARTDPDLELFVGWHHTRYARIASVTGLLRHYPFAGPFTAKVRDAVLKRRFGSSANREYNRYWNALKSNPQRRLRSATAMGWSGMAPLIEQQFLVVPDDYVQWSQGAASASQRLARRARADNMVC